MTATLLIGVVAMILLVVIAVAALYVIRQSVSESFRALERFDARHEKSLDTVLNRLMTIRWEDFAAVQSIEEGEEGGFITPAEQRQEQGEEQGEELRQIFTLRERLNLSPEEQALLNEDFPEEMGVKS